MILISQKQNVLFIAFQLISQEEFLYEFLYTAYTTNNGRHVSWKIITRYLRFIIIS